MKKILVVLAFLVACVGASFAQGVEPVTLNIGPAAGVVLPIGDFSNVASTGWTAGIEGRFGSILPFGGLTASFMYASLPTNPSSDIKWTNWNLAVGAEYDIPTEAVKPYIGVDLMYNMLGTNASGSTSKGRGGLGFGAGVQFMNALDLSAKFQMLNLVGKESVTVGGLTVDEVSYNQIAIKLAYLIPVL